MKLYVVINGKKQGPLTFEEVAEKFHSGQLKATDLAWESGMSDWKPVGEICPQLLEQPERETSSAPQSVSGETDALQPDSIFGKHKIVRLLGRGGMGEVYEVEDELTSDRHALKLLSQEVMGQPGSLERFHKEAKVMARMKHSGIVKVDSAGEDDGRHWLRMELMKGREVSGQQVITLEEYVAAKGGRLSEAEVKALLGKILDALGHAHAKGLVHRDLKPANVLFDGDEVKIADFGLVNAAGAEWMNTQVRSTVINPGEEDTLIDTGGTGSRSRALMGTYAFMSPEQKDGLPADARSDLFALGLMTFQMLTGLKSPGLEHPSTLGLGLDVGWDAWLIKTLKDNRDDRFASAEEMQEALDFRAVAPPVAAAPTPAPEPVAPTPQPKPERVAAPRQPIRRPAPAPAKPASRSRSGVVWALALVLVAVGMFAWSPWSEDKKRISEDDKSKTESPSFSSEKPVPYEPTLEPEPEPVRPPAPSRPVAPTLSGEPTEGKAFAVPELELEMLWCAPGTFTMGSPSSEADRDDETQHSVTLTQGFWLGKHEVTQAQWQSIMGSNPSDFKGANLPVETVSWDDVTSFCAKLTERERKAGRLPKGYAYQLPTEAQWEYACRAGTRTAYSFGNTITTKQANYAQSIGETTAAGSYPANAWGFHDMHGNVWEWCRDWYGDYPTSSARDPMGPADGSERVLRGGSWGNSAQLLRSAIRIRSEPVGRSFLLGFRPSLRLVEAEPKEQEKEKVAVSVNAGKAFTIRDLELEMLWCKPGTFTMGSPSSEADREDDETQHAVTLTEGFWLGKHEVTQAQWQSIMGSNPSKFKGANLPVEQVSWDDVMSFCAKLTERERKAGRLPEGYAYQLPTETQWEYACRAGTRTAFSFGNSITAKQANYNEYVGQTTAVGSYPANAWGFHDLHGNVYEWCRDWYGDYPSGSVRDPKGPADGSLRVYRGGSWLFNARYLRSAYRFGFVPDFRYSRLGFRPSLRLVQGRAE